VVERGDRKVSVTRVIDAPAAKIFAVLADPRQHSVIDGSGTVKGNVSGPDHLELGSKFGMKMRWGVPYRIRSKVVEYDENRRIAWAHLGKHRWRYELEPLDDGRTRVTETFDWSTALSPRYIERMGFPEKHPRWMEATLERLAEHVESSPG